MQPIRTIPRHAAATAAIELGDETPIALYRLYGTGNRLLYVGITGNLRDRFIQHAADKAWWSEVKRKTVEWHLTREDARAAERNAIHDERPKHNVYGFIPWSDLRIKFSADELAELALTPMPTTALRLAILQMLGVATSDALDCLQVGRSNRYRVIQARERARRNA